MRRRGLSRRAVLRGAAGAAIALPLLEAMAPRRARGAPEPRGPQRFITFFTPNGHPPRLWRPTGNEASFELSPILAPLAAYKSELLVLRGLSMRSAERPGHDGVGSLLTGTAPAKGISVDQVMAAQLLGRPLPSLELGVCVPARPLIRVGLSFAGPDQPRLPLSDPRAVFARLFPGPPQGSQGAQLAAQRRSVLDGIKENVDLALPGLSMADRRMLQQHLTAIRDLEQQLPAAESCPRPAQPPALDVTDHDRAGEMLKLQLDLLVLALSCDLTRVATLMVAEAAAPRYFRFLGITGTDPASSWVGLSHRSDQAGEAAHARISRWCAEQLAYLIAQLEFVRNGDDSLFDRTTILWGTDCNPDHSHDDLPVLLAGGWGGRLRMGRVVTLPAGTAHNGLLLTLLEGMGMNRAVFGDPRYSNGPLAQLL